MADRMGGTAFKIIISMYFSILRTRGLEDNKSLQEDVKKLNIKDVTCAAAV